MHKGGNKVQLAFQEFQAQTRFNLRLKHKYGLNGEIVSKYHRPNFIQRC